MKTLIWTQHLFGMGHLMRAAALARALADRGVDTLVVSGGTVSDLAEFGDAQVVGLPPCRSTDASFQTLLDEEGSTVTDAWWRRRIARFERIVSDFDPDVLVTETFPFGRRAFRAELLPTIQKRRGAARPTFIVASVRDILVAARPEKARWMADTARRDYDAVLVHGDPAIVRLEDSFGPAHRLTDRSVYTGYVASASGDTAPAGEGDDEIVVSCGSGALGRTLLSSVLHARATSRTANLLRWRVLAGYGVDDGALGEIQANAPDNVIVERARRDFLSLLQRARLSISLGGYNTVVDILASGVPAVVVPTSAPGQTEQEQRARLLADRGLVVCLPERELSADTLAASVDRAMALRPVSTDIDLNGARRSAEIIIERHNQGVDR